MILPSSVNDDRNRLATKTVILRDQLSMEKMEAYCKAGFLLDKDAMKTMNVNLIKISSGLIAPKDVNVTESKTVG